MAACFARVGDGRVVLETRRAGAGGTDKEHNVPVSGNAVAALMRGLCVCAASTEV